MKYDYLKKFVASNPTFLLFDLLLYRSTAPLYKHALHYYTFIMLTINILYYFSIITNFILTISFTLLKYLRIHPYPIGLTYFLLLLIFLTSPDFLELNPVSPPFHILIPWETSFRSI